MNRNDRRYLRTHAEIRRSFEELILEKQFNEITITELANRANINRKTFYLHFASLNAVLEEIQKEIIDELTELEDMHGDPIEPFHPEELMREFFGILSRNIPLHRRIFSSGSYQFLMERIRGTMMKRYADLVQEKLSLDRTYIDVFSDFISYGTLFVIRDWLTAGKPVDNGELAGLTARLIRYNIKGLLQDSTKPANPF